MAYIFTCPLDGCNHLVMKSNATNKEDAAQELITNAKQHLAENHTDIHKTDEEVNQDIRSQMTQIKE